MKLKKYILALLVFVFTATACDLVDPSDVENPSITHEKLMENATTGTIPLITGLRLEFSNAVRKTALFTENVSDNYRNEYTFLSNVFDEPRLITPNETALNDRREIYGVLEKGLALSNFGLEVIVPNDEEVTDEQKSTVHFYKGMFLLILSENFAAFPLKEGGALVRAEEVLPMAIEEFNTANSLDNTNNARNYVAIARAQRLLGNKAEAQTAAQNAIGADAGFVFTADYDPINLTNHIHRYATTHQDDMQPLPRMDYLDPKYTEKGTSIASLKAEEAYLILAEAAISNGDEAAAKSNMIEVLTIANGRESVIFDDTQDANKQFTSATKVKFSTGSDAVEGLCVDRASVETHPISDTHLTEADINAVSGKADLYYTLYLLRQEIFFSEGRRMSDLGIKLPVNQRQIETNSAISDGQYGTMIVVPAYIPEGKGLDDYTFDEATNTVTIVNDMNRVIANNYAEVSPFE